MSGVIREAIQNDTDQVASILSDWIDETPWMPRVHTRDQDRAFCADLITSRRTFVLENEGFCAGFVSIDGDDVTALYVARHRRRSGVGAALLARARQNADHLTLWTFQSNIEARAFYAANGFLEVETTDGSGNEERLPDVRMEWRRAS